VDNYKFVIIVDKIDPRSYHSPVDNLYLSFGEGVRRQRRRLRLSQEQLALGAELSRATVASIESGRQVVALHQALALCRALAVDLGSLVAQAAQPDDAGLGLEGSLDAHNLEIIRELRHGLTT